MLGLDPLGLASGRLTLQLVLQPAVPPLERDREEVEAGSLLFQIDPRPYQAALNQAKAAKAKDTAQLESAQLDFARSTNVRWDQQLALSLLGRIRRRRRGGSL